MSEGEVIQPARMKVNEHSQSTPQPPASEHAQLGSRPAETTETRSSSEPLPEAKGGRWTSVLDQFKMKRFFVLRKRIPVMAQPNLGKV
ncbi:hypothetical protein JZ751_019108 [Albula glossodonta]|uniref:Uncharacterized protein n=1 Tax=Albula glossodonta TaxID=121402 RepID=A0A8T2NLE2_9TELE|nr:hypothetical protein JZ751_019108 [Albula glossodonta]